MDIREFDQIDVLMSDGCTRTEAKRRLNRGSSVLTPEDFVREYVANSDAQHDILDEAGCETLEEFLDVCKSGKLGLEDISNGIYSDGGKSYPYVIAYAL